MSELEDRISAEEEAKDTLIEKIIKLSRVAKIR